MEATILELGRMINEYLPQLNKIPEVESGYKASPLKWSKKEIIGHLIDSAQNNIRRFITAQYEENPKIVYNQDVWVMKNNYQNYNLPDLISHWHLLNKQIVHILQNIPAEMQQRTCQTEDTHTLEWLAADYVKHLKHHLHQALNLNPFAYP